MTLRSGLLRFAQPEATLHSLLRNVMQSEKAHSGCLRCERRIEACLIEQHFTGDGKKTIGNRAQSAPMTMSASA